MDKELLHILQHSLGVDQYGHGEQYRNHFATDPGGKDFAKCQQLAEIGLMKDLGTRKLWGDMHCFVVTPAGKEAVALHSPAPPKISKSKRRYQEYLECADCFESFRDFLRYDTDRRRGLCA
ncbi:hypothetical protein Despr_1008 [Desulfobulbus propionicus DSM 2032]|jgi:hypothetical protein|uniref:Uncharacterized protein n=1 Tax=Desulfobulbus propionicus (strain ATCC 33891 / DSM 2032 / VKM B-1956 / 1pr3) TaxID=577650 RepID=A0A7U3YKQ2_DESPD|nr:hypothetical protein [Desulfobulbus propionicus]ADW17181.1 hypothetical protein Despr_1008 [Desulfobulbus propionicus DSM 2032]